MKQCVDSLKQKLIGLELTAIYGNFGDFANDLVNDSQMRWLGPECGVVSLAACAILNSLWDLWAKLEGKPMWKLLCDMPPQVY